MESRRDSWRSVKQRVLGGYKAMTSLGEDNEDTPYPAPRPITGLPEPISKDGLQDLFYSDSASGPSSGVEFKMDWKCAETTLKSGIRMGNISGSESEMDEINTQNALKSGTEIDNTSEPSMKGVRRDIRNYIHTLHSTIVDLRFKNQHLYRDNTNLRSKYNDCIKRYGILQGREEKSDKETEFTRKFLECSKYKGENGFQTVQDLKTEKRVEFCFGKKERGDSPLLDPDVKAQVDKRLEAITRLRSDDHNDKRILNDTDNLKEGMVFNREEPSIALCDEVNKGIVDDISIKDNVPKILDMVENINSKDNKHKALDIEHSINGKGGEHKPLDIEDSINGKESEHKPLDTEDSINGKDNEHKPLDIEHSFSIKNSEPKQLDTVEITNSKDNEPKSSDINHKDNEPKTLDTVNKNKTKRRASNMEPNSAYDTIAKDIQSYIITDGYLTCKILKPGYMKQEQKTVAKDNTLEEAIANTGKEGQRTYPLISSRSDESVRLDVDALGIDVKRILNEVEKLESYLEDKAEYKAAVNDMPPIKDSLYCEDSLGKYNKPTPMLDEIEKLGYSFEDTSEDDSVMEGRKNINNTPSIEETTKYSLGKYKTLPPIDRISNIPFTPQNPGNNKPKQSSSSHHDPSKINSHVSTKVTIKSIGSYTAHTPKSSARENKNKSRLVKLLPQLKEQTTTRNTCLNTKSSSKNNEQNLPKIKSMKSKDATKGNITLTKKIKLPVLPSPMKIKLPALPRMYEPRPPTTKQSKRPYTGKYNKLPFK